MTENTITGKTAFGLAAVVQVGRSGSGDCVVQLPNDRWLEAVRSVRPGKPERPYEPYADFRVAFLPGLDGYGEMPGCLVQIIPGNHNGELNVNGRLTKPEGIPSTSGVIHGTPSLSGMLGLSISFWGLKELHEALGTVIAGIEQQKIISVEQ